MIVLTSQIVQMTQQVFSFESLILLFTFFIILVTLISEIVSSEVNLTNANYKIIDQTLHNNIPR